MSKIVNKYIEVCVFKFQDDTPSYLMLRRSKDQKVYPDLWQFVSGSVDEHEIAVDAALRELQEEAGFIPKAFWVVPHVNSFYDPQDDCINVNPMFAAQVEAGSQPKLSQEHSDFAWLPFEEALKRLVWPGQRQGLRIVHEFIVRGEEAATYTRLR